MSSKSALAKMSQGSRPAVTRRAASTLPAATSVMQMPVCCVNSFSTAEKAAVRLPA
jgi:hypothetical protein